MKRAAIYFWMALPPVLAVATYAWMAARPAVGKKTAGDMEALLAAASVGEPPQTDDPQVRKGWEVYTKKGCVYCHGIGGEGGVENPNFKGKTMPALKLLVGTYTDEELRTRILQGVAKSDKEDPAGPEPMLWMPAWKGVLSEAEMKALLAYLRFLAPAEEGWGE